MSLFRNLFRKRTGTAAFLDFLNGPDKTAKGGIVQPYAKSAWVHSAIKFVANPVCGLPLTFSEDRRGGDMVVEDPALTKFWERPALARGGKMTRSDFIFATIGWRLLAGESFWILDDTWLTRSKIKSPLILACPSDMREILAGGGRELVGWSYTDASGKRHDLIPEQVIQIKGWNPYNEFRGLADWAAAEIATDADYAAGMFARNLARNNGDRGPYVIGKNGVADDAQQKQITAMLRQKREMASRGDFRAVFLTGDIEVKEPTLQAVDAAYVAQRLENRKEVYVAFGVPPSFADSQASYSVGSASDRFKLIEETCIPLSMQIADGIEHIAALQLGGGRTIFAEFCWDEHSTMQQIRSERFDIATKAVDRGMPWHEASEYFALKLPRFAGDDVGRIPFNLTEITGPVDPVEVPEITAPDPVAELEQLFAARSAAPCGCISTKAPGEEWAKIHKAREPWEKKFEKTIRRHVMDARGETLRKISAAAALQPKGLTQKWAVLDLIFDLASWLPDWTKSLTTISRSALEVAGFEVWTDELAKDNPLTMPASEVIAATQARENLISAAGTKIHADIKAEIEAAITAGDTMEEIAARVKSEFAGISDQRAMTIARTEVTCAYETGRDMAFRQAGVEWTKWVTVNDGEDRHPSYSGLHNQVRPIDEPFNIYGSVTLRFPGDPEGPPAEIINCRCVRVATMGPDPAGTNNDNTLPY